MTPEGAIQKTILDWLATTGVLAFRMNTGAVKTDARFFRFGVPGMADILAFTPYFSQRADSDVKRRLCIPVWIEVKTPKGRQSEFQKSFQRQVETAGHRYILARDLDDVIEAIGG